MTTRVRFKDGTEENEPWASEYGGPAVVLTAAIALAELRKGEPHDGAWLEFTHDKEA